MKTASELGIPEEWHAALALVMEKLDSGELRHADVYGYDTPLPEGRWFNMKIWHLNRSCGSCACIGGWAEWLGQFKFDVEGHDDEGEPLYFDKVSPALEELFYPSGIGFYGDITPGQAAHALRNYFYTGEARWREVLPASMF